jgi:hypothetical protein
VGRSTARLFLAIITRWVFMRPSKPRADRCAKEVGLGSIVCRWPNTPDKKSRRVPQPFRVERILGEGVCVGHVLVPES